MQNYARLFPHPLALAFVTSPCLHFSIFFSFYPFGEVWAMFPSWIHENQKRRVPSWHLNKLMDLPCLSPPATLICSCWNRFQSFCRQERSTLHGSWLLS